MLQKKRKLSNGKCLVIGESVKSTDIEKGKKRQSRNIVKGDEDYDPAGK